jgi:hypothetical protein
VRHLQQINRAEQGQSKNFLWAPVKLMGLAGVLSGDNILACVVVCLGDSYEPLKKTCSQRVSEWRGAMKDAG